MSTTLSIQSLGSILQKADLVSTSQIEVALKDQIKSKNMKIGEILAMRGWIKQETADFFAERWNSLLNQKSKHPLGYYLEEAALLTKNQINVVLSQQRKRKELRFGTLVVFNGWLKPTTIEFFLNYFHPERSSNLRQNYSLNVRSSDDTSFNSLEAMRKSLLKNEQCDSTSLLRLYQQILLEEEIPPNSFDEQAELIRLGLVVNDQNQLKVASKIYQAVFNPCWVDQELTYLDPYSKIKLKLFKLDEKASLPYRLLTEILSWTGNQPYLVQKLVQIIQQSELFIRAGEEAIQMEKLVQTNFIENWENQAAANHLQEIRDRFLHNQQCEPLQLAKLYRKILWDGEILSNQNSPEETELINLGLVIKEKGKLKVANRIYYEVFNVTWLKKELVKMIETSPSPTKTTNDQEKESVVAWLEKDVAKMVWASPSAVNKNTADMEVQPILSIKATRIDHDKDNLGNRKNKWILVALILLGAGWLSFKFFTQSREAKIFQEGNDLFVQGIHQEAIAKYNQVLQINANYYQAWTNRGYAFAGLKEYQKMLDSCISATLINPEALYGWNCQGEALYNLKQYDKAIATFDKAIALEPEKAIFWINKAESLLAQSKNDQALEVIDEAIRLLNSDQEVPEEEKIQELSFALSRKGKALWQENEYERALEAYEQALNFVPDYFVAQRDRGIVLRKLERFDEAVVNFNQMLNNSNLSSAKKAEIWYYLGLSLMDLSRDQEAIAAFDKALKLKPDYQAAVEAQKTIVKRANYK